MADETTDWSNFFVVKIIQNYHHTKIDVVKFDAQIILDCGDVRCWMR